MMINKPICLYLAPSWGRWSDYSVCNAACGTGIQEKTRQCIGATSTKQCLGSAKSTKTCTLKPCYFAGILNA